VTWGAVGACPRPEVGVVIGVDHQTGIISVRRDSVAEVAPVATNQICPEDDSGTFIIDAVSDVVSVTAGIDMDLTLDGCDRADAPCYLVEGENPDNPALFDFDWGGDGDNDMFEVTDDINNVGTGAVQNVICDYSFQDCVSTATGAATGGHFVGLNFRGLSYNTGDVGPTGNNNVFTTHQGGWITVLGKRSQASSLASSTTGNGSPVAVSNTSLVTGGLNWFGTGDVFVDNHITANSNSAPMYATGGHMTVIGPRIWINGIGHGHAIQFSGATALADVDFTLQFARVVSRGSYNGNLAAIAASRQVGAATGTINLTIWESTFSGDVCFGAGNMRGGAGIFTGRGVVCDLTAIWGTSVTTLGEWTFDVEGSYDEDDAHVGLCWDGAASGATAAACQALLGANFFATNSFESGGVGVDGMAWNADAWTRLDNATLATPGFDPTATPPEINCSGCDFTVPFSAGDFVSTAETSIIANGQLFRVSAVAATKLTLTTRDRLQAEDATANVDFYQFGNPDMSIHSEHEAFQQAIDDYLVMIPHEDGYIPAWTNRGQTAVHGFSLSGKVGGR
jgi:hypothetical protein